MAMTLNVVMYLMPGFSTIQVPLAPNWLLLISTPAFHTLIFGIFAMLHMVILYSITCYFHELIFFSSHYVHFCLSVILENVRFVFHSPRRSHLQRCKYVSSLTCMGSFSSRPIMRYMDVTQKFACKSISLLAEFWQFCDRYQKCYSRIPGICLSIVYFILILLSMKIIYFKFRDSAHACSST